MGILSRFLKAEPLIASDESSDDTPKEEIDGYLHVLKAKQAWWAHEVSLNQRIDLLQQVQKNVVAISNRWVDLDAQARHTEKAHWDYSISMVTPGLAAVSARLWLRVLHDIRDQGKPMLCKKIRQEEDHVALEILPYSFKDRITYRGAKGIIHLKSGTRVEDLNDYQSVYEDPSFLGGVSLVLASGNYAHLTFFDIFHKLIGEKNVVLVKISPVKEYMFEIINTVFKPFIDAGVLRIIRGGRAVCLYAAHHPLVDNLHMTGSNKTLESLMYGTGNEGIKNKENDTKLLNIPMTGELGCVTPIIIVPGKWSQKQFEYQAKNIVSMLGFNSGFSCCAPRVLIMPKGWDGSLKLMNLIRHYMKKMPIASNYYPGSNEAIESLEKKYSTLEKIGTQDATHQPWMLISNIDLEQNFEHYEYLFQNEIWAAFMCQVLLPYTTVESYLSAAVEFANTQLWGTLSAMILIDKKTQRKLEKTGSMTEAIRKLRYGVVSINLFSGQINGSGLLPWGGYPGSSYTDIQSGNVYINNLMMLDNVEKSVVWAPFPRWGDSPQFITNKKILKVAEAWGRYNLKNQLLDLFKLIVSVW